MCGIAGIHVKDRHVGNKDIPLEDLVDGLLLGIEKRGHHATGLVAVTPDGKHVQLHKLDLAARWFVQLRQYLPENVKTILLHTRYATQGDPERNENNHPVVYKDCYAVHNGHINNDDRLFKENHMFRPAEVDSVAIPMMVHHLGWEKAAEAFDELQGPCATAIINPKEHPGELILAKTYSSPLVFFEDNRFIIWASELEVIQKAWHDNYGTPPHKDKFQELESYQMAKVVNDELVVEKFRTFQYQNTGPARSWSRQDSAYDNPKPPTEGGRTNLAGRAINTERDRRAYWWDYDAEGCFDPGGATQRIREGKDTNSLALCVECGEMVPRMELKYMKDGTVVDKVVYEWDVPVCTNCIQDDNLVNFCAGFTYLAQGAMARDFRRYDLDSYDVDELKQFESGEPWEEAVKDDDRCDECGYFPMAGMGRKDRFLCRSCLLSEIAAEAVVSCDRRESREKREAEERQKIVGDLKPGDKIPDEIRAALGDCDVCEERGCWWISKDGLAICGYCKRVDDWEDANAGDAMRQPMRFICDACESDVPTSERHMTVWGNFCNECFQVGQQRSAEGDLTERAIIEAARDVGHSENFVRWILVECTPQMIREMEMSDYLKQFGEAFDKAKYVLRILVNKGEIHDVIEDDIDEDTWKRALATREVV